jgi:ATP-binding protein involved in chromosome partitioning
MAEAGKSATGGQDSPAEGAKLGERMAGIRHKILVLSGKGGVGKSSVAAGLAIVLARRGQSVGVLDVDIHGPSIPQLLDVGGERIVGTEDAIQPVMARNNIRVISLGFLLQGTSDAVIWRGPIKYNVIKQLLTDVEWGDLDYLIVDCPPGTGDEPLTVAQLVPDADGALIVTTPQMIATNDVRRSISFARQLNLPILGVLENMSGFVCPDCGAAIDVFGAGGGTAMAEEMGVPFLGRVPIDADMVAACDAGTLDEFLAGDSPGAEAFIAVTDRLIRGIEDEGAEDGESDQGEGRTRTEMAGNTENGPGPTRPKRIALPAEGDRLAQHFGHSSAFVVFESSGTAESVRRVESLDAPPHQPGLLPKWLKEHDVDVVIAGGMGQRAQQLFCDSGIEVVVGADSDSLEDIARAYVAGGLKTGPNVCDH